MRIGVCSWSLRPRDPSDLAGKVRATGLSLVQLALEPLRATVWSGMDTLRALEQEGIAVASAMMEMRGEDYSTLESIKRTGGVRPDEHWEANVAAARQNAVIARRLGANLVTLHAGFLPHEKQDPLRATMLKRLQALADIFARYDVRVALETGQETAETLLDVLGELERPAVGVNFDPANMILYGTGDPIEALRRLAPCVRQLHIKDALPTRRPGTWGTEVRVGTGGVDWAALFTVLREASFDGDLMIEREAGEDRIGDIAQAHELVERYVRGSACV
ncbi:MAG: sugar phosphate isomerase/epimerase family protein [Planctomycetota bacterium]